MSDDTERRQAEEFAAMHVELSRLSVLAWLEATTTRERGKVLKRMQSQMRQWTDAAHRKADREKGKAT